ncbi:MAG: hypothetical protein Q8J64_07740 [Thermodesulfovibrionales bacterium]|nr:hypothetical protein [Thermodesulfovibrionales bacterium]
MSLGQKNLDRNKEADKGHRNKESKAALKGRNFKRCPINPLPLRVCQSFPVRLYGGVRRLVFDHGFALYCIYKLLKGGEMPLTKKNVIFPVSVFETADTKEDLEDWLLAQNPEFIKKMRKAKKDDMQGKGKDWKTLKTELCLK